MKTLSLRSIVSCRSLSRLVFGIALSTTLAPVEPTNAQSAEFRRLESNCDGQLNLADPVFVLGWLFLSDGEPCCMKAADANDDSDVDVSDVVYALVYLFGSGPQPPAPFPECGPDPTSDSLTCEAFADCDAQNADPELTEWIVPWRGTRPRDPYVRTENQVWFVGQTDDYVAVLDVVSGEFTRFELDAGVGPHNLIVGEYVWYAGNHDAHIGRLDPKTGDITEYPMPDPAASDPHTLIFDQHGDIWFTVQRGNFVGKLFTQTGVVKLIPVPTTGAKPYGIDLDSTDRPWVVEFGSNKLATVDPMTMEIEEFTLPRSGARPRRVSVTSDDRIWYVDYAQGYLGRFIPETKKFDEWPLPGGSASRPYGMAVDHRDRLWCVETGPSPNRFVGFDPSSLEFFSTTDIESGGGSVRHMFFYEPTREIWFGTDANTVGRARVN